ncbi:MAG: hypothetical protein GWM87_08880, partial [Xanthomonadales bacterium]|nr:hypothetical protein [Xanthomonadales bacterium]NIX13029.1 hypothetical protein [Xanthomonadales bacterium]
EGRELYVEATWSESETELVLAPIPAGEWLAINYDNPVLTPATAQLFAENLIPLGGGIGLGRFFKRFEELGPRDITLNSEYTRLLAGMRGDFGSDWEYDAWVTFT